MSRPMGVKAVLRLSDGGAIKVNANALNSLVENFSEVVTERLQLEAETQATAGATRH